LSFDPLSLPLTEALAKNDVVDLDTGDIALLNYAYVLEQLEAAFYTVVMASPYSGMSRYERSVLSDVKGHEIADRKFFRKALGSSPWQKPFFAHRLITSIGQACRPHLNERNQNASICPSGHCRENIRITWISCPSPLGARDRVPLVRRNEVYEL